MRQSVGRVFSRCLQSEVALAWVNLQVWPDKEVAAGSAAPNERLKIWLLGLRLAPTVVWSTAVYTAYTYLGAGLTLSGYSTDEMAERSFLYGCGSIVGILIGGRMADQFGSRLTTTAAFGGLCICLIMLRFAVDTGILVTLAFGLVSAVAQVFFPAQQAGLAKDFSDRRAGVLAWNNSALFLRHLARLASRRPSHFDRWI